MFPTRGNVATPQAENATQCPCRGHTRVYVYTVAMSSMSMYTPRYASMNVSMRMPMHMSVHMPAHISNTCLHTCLHTHLCTCLGTCACPCLHTCLCCYFAVHQCMSMHMSMHVSAHTPIHMLVRESVYISTHMSAHMSTHMSIHMSMCAQAKKIRVTWLSAIRLQRELRRIFSSHASRSMPTANADAHLGACRRPRGGLGGTASALVSSRPF